MAKTQEDQIFYNKLLITQVINYQKLGYTDIKINNENYVHGQPSTVCGYTPDLTAVFDDQTVLCEVVTKDSMNETGMIERWKTLSKSGYDFHMIIPRKSFDDVKEFAKSSGIHVDKYWYSKNC